MQNNYNSVRRWIEDLPKRGRITFSLKEAEESLPYASKKAIQSSIYKLKIKGRICSVWRSFYVIVPDEYALKGTVPPIEYIDYLMAHLGYKYYIGLLSAAAIYGAGHQQPQILTVISNNNDIRSNNDTIHFMSKNVIPTEHLIVKNAGYGKVVLSSPELTAIDLVCYESRIGGLNRVAEIINEMSLDFNKTDVGLWQLYKTPVVQRLGYIMESILGCEKNGEVIYQKAQLAGLRFRKSLLAPNVKQSSSKLLINEKWRIIINCDLEIEE